MEIDRLPAAQSSLTAGAKRGEIRRINRYERFTGEGLVYGIERNTVGSFQSRRGFCVLQP
jgi:hypothetical protein